MLAVVQLRARPGAQHHRRSVHRDDHLTGPGRPPRPRAGHPPGPRPERPPHPLVVAHRGAWGEAPPNSLAALEAAVALGADAVELDVRVTRDGHLVVVHAARVGGVGGLVSRLDRAQLHERVAPDQIPALAEMAEAAAGRIALDVELKVDTAVGAVLAELARRLEPSAYVVTSFLDAALAAVHDLAPEVRTGLLIGPGRRARRLERRLELTAASFVAPHASLARGGLLAWAAARELDSWVWTVNDRRALRVLAADPRVAALITDRPARALEARDGD
ncbi:MAG TPA: glycerophosphodiester phosphodiesterase [Solirubrobacteraceae bacterium]|nr:glycerophosphodiester phosphodiesterase [Solirubrobacteraceae bacterium]